MNNRKFWKTVMPALSEKCQSNNKIVLVEDDEIISDDIEVAEIFNRFFVTVTESLSIKENNDNISDTEGISDPIEKSVQKYSNHPSILKIKSHFLNVEFFVFFYSSMRINNKFYILLYLSNYSTTPQERYQGERKTMTTPWPKHKDKQR